MPASPLPPERYVDLQALALRARRGEAPELNLSPKGLALLEGLLTTPEAAKFLSISHWPSSRLRWNWSIQVRNGSTQKPLSRRAHDAGNGRGQCMWLAAPVETDGAGL